MSSDSAAWLGILSCIFEAHIFVLGPRIPIQQSKYKATNEMAAIMTIICLGSVTPAMEAGIADHIWSLDEIIQLLP